MRATMSAAAAAAAAQAEATSTTSTSGQTPVVGVSTAATPQAAILQTRRVATPPTAAVSIAAPTQVLLVCLLVAEAIRGIVQITPIMIRLSIRPG